MLGLCDGSKVIDQNWPLNNDSTNYYGTHDGGNNIADTLFDSSMSWDVDSLWSDSLYVWNITDDSRGLIIDNTDTSLVVDSLYGGTDNDWDTNDTYKITNGWPCLDQPGFGMGMPGSQISESIYEWNNIFADTGDCDFVPVSLGGCDNPDADDHIKEGREFYSDTEMPGYTPFPYPHLLRRSPRPNDPVNLGVNNPGQPMKE